MPTLMIFRAASWLLGLALASGLVMAGLRFATDRAIPPWLAKLHGFAAVATLALLGLAAAGGTLAPAAQWGGGLLAAAAAGGVLMNLRYHWRGLPLPEGLLFAHLSVGFIGALLVVLGRVSLGA